MAMIIGHRGAAGSAPENTLASMRWALAIGVDGVEFDVHRTRDGHLVVIHDATVDRTTDGTGRVADMTLDELRRLDAGGWRGDAFRGQQIPTLVELVEAVPAPTRLFLELKAGAHQYPGIEEELAQFLLAHGLVERTQVSSFDHQALLRLRLLLPALPTGMLYHCLPVDPVAMAKSCGANALHPHWAQVTAEQVAAAHQAGLVVNAWTVNSEEAIGRCRSLGVDGIISDHPERL